MICSFSFILTDLLSTYQRPSFSGFFCLFSLWWLLTIHLAKTEHKRVGWHTQQNPSSHSSGGWKSGDSLVGFWGELSSWLVERQPASHHVLKWPFLCAWRDSERGRGCSLVSLLMKTPLFWERRITLKTSFHLNHFLGDPASKLSYTGGIWGHKHSG